MNIQCMYMYIYMHILHGSMAVMGRLLRRRILKELMRLQRSAERHKVAQLKSLKEHYNWNRCSLKNDSTWLEKKASYSQSVVIPNAFKQITAGGQNQSTVPSTLYTTCHMTSGRPYQVWVYDHCNHGNTLIFEESDCSCTVDVALTRDEQYITINSNSRTTSEVHILRSRDIMATPTLVRPRETSVEYYIDHAHNRFYLFTNVGEDNEYKVMTAADEKELCSGQWKEYYQPKDGFVLQDMELFSNCVFLIGVKNLVPVAMVINVNDHNKEPLILSGEDFCYINKTITPPQDFDSTGIPLWFSTPFSSPTLHLHQNEQIYSFLSKSSENYSIDRTHATNTTRRTDIADVPITLVYKKNKLKKNGNNPLLVQVYGCYGENLYMGYQPEMQYLLERGWILASCHVRGGGERGRRWYYKGRGKQKGNTFEDLHACVTHLQTTLCLSRPHLTVLSGRSAGGQAVGMFCNRWPQLIQAAVLQVPFVNVIDTLSDSSLYLSNKDYEEFGGNPCNSHEEKMAVFSVCPYSTLVPQDYPAMFISASKVDEIVPFEGIEKYVIKLKHCIEIHQRHSQRNKSRLNRVETDSVRHGTAAITGAKGDESFTKYLKRSLKLSSFSEVTRGSVVFHVDEKHGHYGSSSVDDSLKDAAERIDFLNSALNFSST